MSVNPIQGVATQGVALQGADFLAPSRPLPFDQTAASSGGFAAWLDKELTAVNGKIVESDAQLRKLAAGETDNLHQVMIAMEEAKLSFQLALQVRNRMLEAYQEILRMQI